MTLEILFSFFSVVFMQTMLESFVPFFFFLGQEVRIVSLGLLCCFCFWPFFFGGGGGFVVYGWWPIKHGVEHYAYSITLIDYHISIWRTALTKQELKHIKLEVKCKHSILVSK